MTWDAAKADPEWPFEIYATRFKLSREATALLVIDMQTADLRMGDDSEVARKHPAIAQYWNRRVADVVVPGITRLIAGFRSRGLKIVYTRNGALTTTGDEMTRRLRPRGHAPKAACGNPADDLAPALAPRAEDLVITKLTSGAFTATSLDHALRNMGVRSLVVTGILTDMCILGTARTAAELGYDSLICEDACATLTDRAHCEALLMHARVFGRVASVAEVSRELEFPGS